MNRGLTDAYTTDRHCLKAIAIIAVKVDHCFGMLYNSILILHAFRFSVGLFVILSGYSSFYANEKRKRNIGHQLERFICNMQLQH